MPSRTVLYVVGRRADCGGVLYARGEGFRFRVAGAVKASRGPSVVACGAVGAVYLESCAAAAAVDVVRTIRFESCRQ